MSSNHDLFRASMSEFEPARIAKAFDWLDGKGPFPAPASVHFDLTLRCTAHCVHCEQWRWPRHRELRCAELQVLFDTFQSWGVSSVTLGGGNPLLHPHLSEVLAMASKKEIVIGIVTEGALLSPKQAESIGAGAAWVRFSLDGPSPEIHDRIRRSPGLFAMVATAISQLRTRNSNLPVGLNCVVQKENFRHLPRMLTVAEQLGATGVFFKLAHGDDPSGRFLLDIVEFQHFWEWVSQAAGEHYGVETNLAQLETVLKTIVTADDAVRGRPIRTHYQKQNVRCFVPLFFMACDSEANAYPCDYLQADTRLWEGHYSQMRERFCAGNILENANRVLERMEKLVRSQVHGLPCGGYDECGCCTRFCQLNTGLSWIDESRKAKNSEVLLTSIDTTPRLKPHKAGPQFL